MSTFLAITPIGFSQSHASITFFRMVSLTVLFGLFHGLIFLPVMLAIFGADCHEDMKEIKSDVELHKTADQSVEMESSVTGIDNLGYQSDGIEL